MYPFAGSVSSMVKNGMGISVIYQLSINVKAIKLQGENYRTIGIAAASLKTFAPATKKFIEYLKSWLNEPPHFQ